MGSFIHLQTETRVNPNTGKTWEEKILIFPRYHQMDCVRRLVAGALASGAGTNFLVQHSRERRGRRLGAGPPQARSPCASSAHQLGKPSALPLVEMP